MLKISGLNQSNSIKVWDPLVRIFHWTLVLAFLIAFITEEDFLSIHTFAGYTLLALIFIRIIWGFIGSRYARFSDFIYSSSEIKQFLKDSLSFKAKRYIGHNPAGGAMILLLLSSLLITTITGIAVYGAEEQAGPMAALFAQDYSASNGFWGDALEDVHEFFANFSVFLIVIHILGVIVESFIHQENLVRAMLDGSKAVEKQGQAK